MRAARRRFGPLIVNGALFVFFFDVAAHQLVARLLASGLPLQRWYLAAPDTGDRGSGLPSWYSIYSDWRWMERAVWSRLDLADWTFTAQTLTLCGVLLLRRSHQALDSSALHQGLALVAFGSGVFFVGAEPTAGRVLLGVSYGIVLAANALAILTLANLGRSFGILIALRRVETRGLYGLVRHPMYTSDILLRLGYLAGHFSLPILGLGAASIAAYVYRALLEERFLSRDPAYRDYLGQVRWRFVPGLI